MEYDGFRRRAEDKMELDESFSMCPKYAKHDLTDEQIEEIAERAAERAIIKAQDRLYQEVGKGVLGKLYWIVGLVVVGAGVWMANHGLINIK